MIYLDHHAATPLHPEARRAMAEVDETAWGNPSSAHAAGRRARGILEGAREIIAGAVGARPADLVLTGGGTEACNLGLRAPPAPEHRLTGLIASGVEHPAVGETVRDLSERGGVPLRILDLPAGRPPPGEALRALLQAFLEKTDADPRGILVALQWVNHETGTILPIPDYAEVVRQAGATLFVDATQALGKVPVDVAASGAHRVAFAAHKVGGPAGAGALWVDRSRGLEPVLTGGSQERGRRPGTPDVRSQAGFAGALRSLPDRLAALPRLARGRDRLEGVARAHRAVVNGAAGPRVATVTNVSVPGWRGPALVAALDLEGLAASSGAACSSGLDAPSPVLRAMSPEEPWRAESALRLSLGPETTEDELEGAAAILGRVLPRAGNASPATG